MNKEMYYLVLPASESPYVFRKVKEGGASFLPQKVACAIFEKNPKFVLEIAYSEDEKGCYVTDIAGGLEELITINPLNEELFCKWVNRFDYLCTIMGALGLESHLPYVVSDNNPMFCKLKEDKNVSLIKIAKNS